MGDYVLQVWLIERTKPSEGCCARAETAQSYLTMQTVALDQEAAAEAYRRLRAELISIRDHEHAA